MEDGKDVSPRLPLDASESLWQALSPEPLHPPHSISCATSLGEAHDRAACCLTREAWETHLLPHFVSLVPAYVTWGRQEVTELPLPPNTKPRVYSSKDVVHISRVRETKKETNRTGVVTRPHLLRALQLLSQRAQTGKDGRAGILVSPLRPAW